MLSISLILLLCAVGSILLFLRASHEVPRVLAVGSAILCLICGVAMAPWPIQLLVFLLILSLERLRPFKTAVSESLPISSRQRR
ncbi:MAG: hypothetical protein F6K14_27835 [Symploca sp. SIO2C1]|nr:hypothetical protein [Symploca sp. SIO2C1]